MNNEEYFIKYKEMAKENEKLKTENIALKIKIELMYSNWKYDYERFNELKDKCRMVSSDLDIKAVNYIPQKYLK